MANNFTIDGGAGGRHVQGSHYTGTFSGFTASQLVVNGRVTAAIVQSGKFNWEILADEDQANYAAPGVAGVELSDGENSVLIDTMTVLSAPISEKIALNIKSTVAAIVAGTDYVNTVVECVRPNAGLGTETKDLRCILAQDDPQFVGARPQMFKEWLHPFLIICQVRESESSGTPIDNRLNTIRADVEKSLMVDQHRHGRAIATEIDTPAMAMDVTAHEGEVTVKVNVRYRTKWNDTYSQ